MSTRRIAKDALLLAILCLGGMFAIPFGDSVKVSLQILLVFIICFISDSIFDSLIITSLYLALGLFMPIYAGFNAGITPTFGYVVSFVIICIPLHLIKRIKNIPEFLIIIISCLSSLLVSYIIGSTFMYFYLNGTKGGFTLGQVLLISVVPYIPFDIVKVIIAAVVVKLLPSKYKGQ